jgi:ubiquinone/menaquinone biosynthesis C-methylase UbiE
MRCREQWNHNNHYHPWIMRRLPSRFERALDVGCGQGFFAARLAGVADRVDAIDVDENVLAAASRLQSSTRIVFREGDFLEMGLPSDSYDVVTSIAALHHMDFERALGEMRRLLQPGGHLAVLGLYREASMIDYAVSVLAMPANLMRTRIPSHTCESTAPTAPTRAPESSLSQIRRAASAVLPGVRIDRHLYWRYSLLWRKPTGARHDVESMG